MMVPGPWMWPMTGRSGKAERESIMDLTKGDQFYDEGIDLSDAEFYAAEDGCLEGMEVRG